jgi:hypothetical protein
MERVNKKKERVSLFDANTVFTGDNLPSIHPHATDASQHQSGEESQHTSFLPWPWARHCWVIPVVAMNPSIITDIFKDHIPGWSFLPWPWARHCWVIPVVAMNPSIITDIFKDHIPGWMEGTMYL